MYSLIFHSMFNNQPDLKYTQQYIELQAKARCPAGYSAVYSITNPFEYTACILNYQPEPNVQLVIRQYIQ